MKTVVAIFTLVNLLMISSYLWSAEYNRIFCIALWFIFPIVNCIIYGMLEKRIWQYL